MSHVSDRARRQDATLWTTSPNGSGGDVFGPPQAIKVRWEERSERFISQLDQNERVSQSVVYLGQTAAVGDYLYLGTSAAVDPTVVTGAYKIQRFDATPSLRLLNMVRKAYL